MENNKDVAAVFIEYHIAAVPLEKLLGCKLPYTSKSTSHDGAASTALNKLAQRDRVQHEKAQAAWKSLQRIREAVSVEKQKADLKWYKQRDNERTRASAGTSSAPITRDAMEQAKGKVPGRRPAAPNLSKYYKANRIEQEDNRNASTSLPQDISACDLITGIDPHVVEQREQMIEEERDMAQAQDDVFDQGQVVEGGTVDEQGSEEQARKTPHENPLDLSLRLRDGARLDPKGHPIRILGMDIGAGLSSQEHIRRKCAAASFLAKRLRWIMRDVGAVPLSTRLKLAKAYILPVLDYGSPLHTRMRRKTDGPLVARADKEVFAFVLNVQPTSSFPSAKAMAHELGGN
ncbi:hypothetical protein sr11574 [Sporisorium reilianum SRZ2]|uniref:Uncharacterized protein n=1 Tax=Sporisorium reilianum (strain SRZ2) TaxID=999809 RepID=E6ZJX1_SPORE|nr:hypothetical protein sr11574 [Sporisorium reilianum SRZ2]